MNSTEQIIGKMAERIAALPCVFGAKYAVADIAAELKPLAELIEAAEDAILEGRMEAGRSDVIICGVKGELYPCKMDIFAATYDF